MEKKRTFAGFSALEVTREVAKLRRTVAGRDIRLLIEFNKRLMKEAYRELIGHRMIERL